MKILFVAESPSWVDHHIAGSLRAMGHEVVRYRYGTHVGEFYGRARAGERMRKNDELLQLATSQARDGLDLIFCYVYDDFLLPEHARKLAALGVPLVNFNVDMVNQWYRQSRTARFFTRVLCAQKANMRQLARYGAKVLYFPMAAPLPANDGDDGWRPAAPVTFVGTPMPFRLRVLGELHRAGVPLAVYGKWWREQRQALPDRNREKLVSDIVHYGWPRLRAEGVGAMANALRQRLRPTQSPALDPLPDSVLHGFVPDGRMQALFRHSRINLGFSRMSGDDPAVPGINQVKLRDFEVPMAGGFYLMEHAPDYDELFVPGREVETWRTLDELNDKLRYYLDHPAQCAAIAQAGARRARAEHSWQHRFAQLFTELGLRG
ncbi:MAG TPA: glycosyltransferase [Candidatus Acidoferrum sp.]|nr:glycosyltransferase [Candidatus Acidoferrum sp.]